MLLIQQLITAANIAVAKSINIQFHVPQTKFRSFPGESSQLLSCLLWAGLQVNKQN